MDDMYITEKIKEEKPQKILHSLGYQLDLRFSVLSLAQVRSRVMPLPEQDTEKGDKHYELRIEI